MTDLTKEQFWSLTTISKTNYGFMLRTKTPICEYGQAYKKGISKEEIKTKYLDFYYTKLYLMDLELKENGGND